MPWENCVFELYYARDGAVLWSAEEQLKKREKAICVIGLKEHSRFGVFRAVDQLNCSVDRPLACETFK